MIKRKFDLQLFGDFLVNYGVSLQIDIDPTGTPTLTEMGDGFDNIEEVLNEILNQYFFLNKGGFGKTHVTGMQPVWKLTGVRKRADAAQNYIFSKKYKMLEERETDLVITYIDGIEGTVVMTFSDVTIANVKEFGGQSTDGAAITVDFHTSGEPTIVITPAA